MLVEGRTEQAFKPHLVAFLRSRLAGNMPRLDMFPYNGRIAMGDDLRRKVEILLSGRQPSDAVIGLTDVYTGTNDFESAADAKVKMRQWVNDNPAFHPHAAQYDFEAWLLPYWNDIQRIAGHNRRAPRDSRKPSTTTTLLRTTSRRYSRSGIAAIATPNREMRIEYSGTKT
jgi:Domain of unknown function (DUF4276)